MVKTVAAVMFGFAALNGASALRPAMGGSAGLARSAVDSAQRSTFDSWAKTQGRTYATSSGLLGASSEYERRLDVFKANLKHAEYLVDTGANKHSEGEWTVSTTGPFMDMTHDEFKATLTQKPKNDNSLPRPFVHADTVAADTVDWVSKGAVTPIKNQGQCGSCWAFSTVGGMEGANFLANGNLTSLSEQQLVSCDDNGDQGCNGGLMDNAFQWIINNGGLDTEADYPYASGGGQVAKCDTSKTKIGAKISSFSDVTANSEDDLRKALTNQPVSVAVDAQLWQYYGGGVFHGVFGYCGTQLDHGVLLVAMDGDAKTYTVKNSWGPTWGEKGFIRLPQDKGAEGMCAIAAAASTPVV